MKKTYKVIPQQGQTDCGVACLLSVIQHYGGTDTLENLRRLSGTNVTGTTLLGLYQAARQLGMDAEGCEADVAALIAHNQPCILNVVIEDNLEHYVVCFGNSLKQGQPGFIIGDPANGMKYLSQEELESIWRSKAVLTLTPNLLFKKAADIDNARISWVKSLLKSDVPLLSIAAALGIGIAGMGLVMSLFSQRLIDDIIPHRNFTKLYTGIALVFILLMSKEGLSYLRQYFLLRQSKDFNIRIIDFFYRHLLGLPKPFFDTRKIGELTARLNDTSRIQKAISQLAGNVIIDTLIVIVSAIFIFTYSWQTGVFCMLAMPVFFFLIYSYNRSISDGQRSIMSSYALTEGNYISTLRGIEPIKNYNKQSLFQRMNATIYKHYQDNVFSLGRIQIRLSFMANFFSVLFITTILCYTSYEVLHGRLKTGELMAVLTMAVSLLPSVANLALIAIPINEAKIAFNRMFEFTAIEPEEVDKINQLHFLEQLQVLHISFRFTGRKLILKNTSFHVAKGEIIAIIGENGSGKSTLTQILQGHYPVETGNILVNGSLPLGEVPLSAWRRLIGVVPQNIHIFNGTVLENIVFDDGVRDPQAITAFLDQYGFSPFIKSLPQSFMTLVGEEGINLSGGQKQMIALARALYHNPELLILDEATAEMDKSSEQFVLRLLTELKSKMAVIFITHRLHVLKSFCNRIYILDNGTIKTSGSHHTLLESDNLYSEYWKDLAHA